MAVDIVSISELNGGMKDVLDALFGDRMRSINFPAIWENIFIVRRLKRQVEILRRKF